MMIDTSCIDAYLKHQKPNADAWFYQYTKGTANISDYRQDVCAYLCAEINRYEQFPIWNKELIQALFPKLTQALADVTIKAILGSNPDFDADLIFYQQKPFLLIDLLNIADYTQKVKEMSYILHNLCHIHLLRYLLKQKLPQPTSYIEQLEYRFFSEGLLLYLSWNENYQHYVFQKEAYKKRGQKALTLYSYALQCNEQTTQKQILYTLQSADLWDRFPDIAGMLFCDTIIREQGIDGLCAYFQQGWQSISKYLF